MNEAHAYITGDIKTANLLDRMDSLQRALGDEIARSTRLEDALAALLDDDNEATRDDARRALCS
ncbi:MAG: hypothetical protein WCG26_07580 [Chloroflexales bacterium]|jgi:hypothetical protein